LLLPNLLVVPFQRGGQRRDFGVDAVDSTSPQPRTSEAYFGRAQSAIELDDRRRLTTTLPASGITGD